MNQRFCKRYRHLCCTVPREVTAKQHAHTSVGMAPGIAFLVAIAACLGGVTTAGEFDPPLNTDFTEGDGAPAGWTLSGGQGRWVDREILEVTGTGGDSNHWRCDYAFEPGRLYRFEMRARRTNGSGCVVAGPVFANRDHRLSNDWQWYGHAFRVPDDAVGSYLRIGQWQAPGTAQFDVVRLLPAVPVHRLAGGLLLGEGESIREGRYAFSATFAHQGSNYHRTLHSATATFNSDRWCFGRGSQVTYRFQAPVARWFQSGKVSFNVSYHTRGGCTAQLSNDESNWLPLAVQEGLGTAEAALPGEILPGKTLFLRLKSSTDDSSFQVNRIEFSAGIGATWRQGIGHTEFAGIERSCPELTLESISLEDPKFSTTRHLVVAARNNGRQSVSARWELGHEGFENSFRSADKPARIKPGDRAVWRMPLTALKPGRQDLSIVLRAEGGKSTRIVLPITTADYYRTDYGTRIADIDGPTVVWWCDAAHKIPPQRALPEATSTAALLSAARNDREAVQIVVRNARGFAGLTATAASLSGPGGATISAENVKVLRVAYHFVHHATDGTGAVDHWPDALPPLGEPIDVPAGKNQPLWVLIHVPKDAAPGDYSGEVTLKADGVSVVVPIELHVWDFTLPERNHLDTAIGLSAGEVFRYHQLLMEEDKRRVLDMYFQSFAEHRISPYDPTPLDPIGVRFLPEVDPPRAELDFSAFDPAFARAVEKFRFTNFRLRIEGMGGGSFHQRYEPRIGDYAENTLQYRQMFSSYVGQLEAHLRAKGWLDMAYIYWFDEPAPNDYKFVNDGFGRLKKHGPGLTTMLTQQPEEALAGAVDIWCPVSHNYDHAGAEQRRAHGERFWWYVCCGPKAPYCTLFIDHPAVELRTWLWQTWQRDIRGILVWRANYWTSATAFPDRPQNPYEDPMGYVSGYSTPKGVKRYWGNGDGRFIYPPEAAAVPGFRGGDPVIEPPVSSIRWEMLREGIEDYEYLYMLRELLAKRRGELDPEQVQHYESLLTVPESITRDMTTFSTDPAPIYARRAAIAEAIERLRQ